MFCLKGGIATVYTGQPLDTIKVKMQMFPHLYKSALRCGVETFKKDGVARGLYAGTVPALTANIAGNIRVYHKERTHKLILFYFRELGALSFVWALSERHRQSERQGANSAKFS